MKERLNEAGEFILTNAVNHAREFIARIVRDGDVVMDATAGNGYDTLFLAKRVGTGGKVFAFDIQEEAVQATARRLKEVGLDNRVELILAGHERVNEFVDFSFRAVMFNLGYLPGNPHGPVTDFNSVKIALEHVFILLQKGGLISIVAYPGHSAGQTELKNLLSFLVSLDQKKFSVAQLRFVNQQNHPPELILVEKKMD